MKREACTSSSRTHDVGMFSSDLVGNYALAFLGEKSTAFDDLLSPAFALITHTDVGES